MSEAKLPTPKGETKMPMIDVPKNDEQAKVIFSRYTPIIGNSLFGIHQCRRALGDSVLEAYNTTLLARTTAVESKNGETT